MGENASKRTLAFWNENATVWVGGNKPKTLVSAKIFLLRFQVETKTATFENALMAKALCSSVINKKKNSSKYFMFLLKKRMLFSIIFAENLRFHLQGLKGLNKLKEKLNVFELLSQLQGRLN